MKLLPLLSCLLFISHSSFAEVFIAKEAGVSLKLPDGWTRDTKAVWGVQIDAPDKTTGIVIHVRNSNEHSLWDSLNAIIATFESKAAKSDRSINYRVLQVLPFDSTTGISGLRIITGIMNSEKRIYPNVFHYVFLNSKGRSTCVCVYASAGMKDAESADELVISNLKILK